MAKTLQNKRLDRTTFQTSRLLDFASRKELTAQCGHEASEWPQVILKELVDNALDACEEPGTAPVIVVIVDKDGINVRDNGPGIPTSTIDGVCDFAVRISSREAYVAPDRGAQGNALKTILAMPFVLDGESGRIEITSHGVSHGIAMSVDRIRQTPVIGRDRGTVDTEIGTTVRVCWPNSACSNDEDEEARILQNGADDFDSNEIEDSAENSENRKDSACSILNRAKSRFLQIGTDYAWLNPHLTITLTWFGETTQLEATDTAWPKWKPSDPTSPHWYDTAAFERLLAGYVAHDEEHQTVRTVRAVISEFNGLTASAKQKLVLDETGLTRTNLSGLVASRNLRGDIVGRLLTSMKKHTRPIKPAALGIIGRNHFESRMRSAGCEMDSFNYTKMIGNTDDGRPWVMEFAFAMRADQNAKRRLITGVNWSPGIVNPFRTLGSLGKSCDTILAKQRIDADDPVILVLHVASPKPQYLDRGKSSVVMEG